MTQLAGQPDAAHNLPLLGALLGATVLVFAAIVVGIALRHVPGVSLLSTGLAVAALFPVVIFAPDLVPINYSSRVLLEYLLIFLELLAGGTIVAATVMLVRRGWVERAPLPENEEIHA